MTSADRLLDRLGLAVPIVQAPMAGSSGPELAAAVSRAGGLGSLPCAILEPDDVRRDVAAIRAATDAPFNLNFFCHEPATVTEDVEMAWRRRLQAYADELGLAFPPVPTATDRMPFGEDMGAVVEELRPAVVSFHFGLPAAALVERVRATGAVVLSSATTVEEAVWLESHGCDVVIAQGVEAGGHRAMFLTTDVATQIGTMALLPQVVDAVAVPVVAAGGIGDARGVAAALALGASAVQVGTAFLLCPEATPSPIHAAALRSPAAVETALTNVFTGRPARSIVNRFVREVGPLAADAPPFPAAAASAGMLRAAAERGGSSDFSPLWAGQAASLARPMPAADLVRALAGDEPAGRG